MDRFMEIFTLLTGVIYIVLEIRQKNFMWVVGVVTSIAAIYTFMCQHLYASVALNAYYFCISFWGLYQWRRDAGKLASMSGNGDMQGRLEATAVEAAAEENESRGGDRIHLNRLGWKTVLGCAVFFVAGLVLLRLLLVWLGDPMSGLDAAVAVLSAVATYMLSRSYIEQWLLWIVADIMSTALCFSQGLYWMTGLYAMYTIAAVYGYIHWKRNGVYVS